MCAEFAAAIAKVQALAAFERVTWTDCFLGATAWYRLLDSEERARADVFLNALEANVTAQLVESGLNVRMKWDMLRWMSPSPLSRLSRLSRHLSSHLSSPAFPTTSLLPPLLPPLPFLSPPINRGEQEARCEWKAVEYAMREATLPPLPPGGVEFSTPSVLLTGGSGSCQVLLPLPAPFASVSVLLPPLPSLWVPMPLPPEQVTGLDAFFSFNAPLKDGAAMVREHGSAAWEAVVEEKLRTGAQGLTALPKLLSLAAERAQSDGAVLDGGGGGGDRGGGGSGSIDKVSVVLISAFYYVAMAAGLVKKGEPYRYQSAAYVCQKLGELREKEGADPKDVANAVRLHTSTVKVVTAGHQRLMRVHLKA